jgi:uncharacterized SAM-binding protein YcdF (DUF218 family)
MRVVRHLLAAVLALIALCVVGFLIFIGTLPVSISDARAKADGIVALTGEGDRLAPAVTLLENGGGKRLLITGVNPLTSKPYLKKLLRGGDSFDCCVDLGFAAIDTRGNAQEAADWARAHRYGSLIIVTADYHMPRSLIEFGAQMPEVRLVPYPVADLPRSMSWQSAKKLGGEYVKYLASVVRVSLARLTRARDA